MKLNQLVIFVFILLGVVSWAQNSSNPFEVKQRISDTIYDNSSEITFTNNSGNPFEINHVPLRKERLKQQNERNNKINPTVSNSFIFWVMLFAWALLAIVLASKRKLLSNLSRALFNENVLKLTKRQENGGLNLHYILLYLVYFVNAAVFLYLLCKSYTTFEGIRLWVYILLGLVSAYLIKHLSLFFLGIIFPLSKETSLYNYCIMVFNLMIGIILIPFNLLLAFGSDLWSTPTIIISLIILGILIIIRYLRGVLIVVNKAVGNLFVFFIYLCTLEIGPLVVLIRFLGR